eukprot:TRINITY_DN120808_c0_g1_i1.p1 TRINITY_DN120808_c0_g1~~TRINITY_DN120808_c0_g1_i1.p1  ORF type:complete len:227 (+),score=28.35 TRINITY_DN120808_c0_g1_i1:81-683(+)
MAIISSLGASFPAVYHPLTDEFKVWRKTPLHKVEECASQYRSHARELKRALRALPGAEDSSPTGLAMAMRREVLQEIYADVKRKQLGLEGVAEQLRQVDTPTVRKTSPRKDTSISPRKDILLVKSKFSGSAEYLGADEEPAQSCATCCQAGHRGDDRLVRRAACGHDFHEKCSLASRRGLSQESLMCLRRHSDESLLESQ